MVRLTNKTGKIVTKWIRYPGHGCIYALIGYFPGYYVTAILVTGWFKGRQYPAAA